jgi:hypothetical protein
MEATPGHEEPQSRGAKQSSYPPFNTYEKSLSQIRHCIASVILYRCAHNRTSMSLKRHSWLKSLSFSTDSTNVLLHTP